MALRTPLWWFESTREHHLEGTMRPGDEWDDVALAHDVQCADYRNYVLGNHPVLPGLERPKASDFEHRPVGCDCIAARYNRREYVKLKKEAR